MSVSRWTVRLCAHCGTVQSSEARRCCRCAVPMLGEPFDVVRAVGARTSDPDTSKLAALQAEPRMGSQRGRLLEAIKAAGDAGLTAREAGKLTGIDGAWKRVSELAQGGHISVAGTRTDPMTGAEGEVYAVMSLRPAPEPECSAALGEQIGLL